MRQNGIKLSNSLARAPTPPEARPEVLQNRISRAVFHGGRFLIPGPVFGEQATNPEPRGTVELAQQHGRSLAAAVETALRGDLQRLHGPLRSAMTRVELELVDPPDRETLQQWASAENIDRCRLGRYLLRRLDEDGKLPTGYRCPVQVIWFGHDLACIPCSTGYRPLNKARFLRDALHSRAYLRVYGKETIEAWDERNACPANGKLCEEAVWFMQKLLLGSRTDMEQIAEAIRKIRKHAALLARA